MLYYVPEPWYVISFVKSYYCRRRVDIHFSLSFQADKIFLGSWVFLGLSTGVN
ncbi:hypothetical protein C2G38_2066822 [Gigaspora rosea]|uniref:Uncharacterized protein n=1 Tax=Gigaspora rosea TaxID=44941 RepID=A0A397VXH4_9GLOM|nr:hypothetical protein C2G38_2066822 [Gigaspora rosea]